MAIGRGQHVFRAWHLLHGRVRACPRHRPFPAESDPRRIHLLQRRRPLQVCEPLPPHRHLPGATLPVDRDHDRPQAPRYSVDPHEGSGTAFFSPVDDGLHFSDSEACRADRAEGADCFIHEYGHAIQNDQVPTWGGTESDHGPGQRPSRWARASATRAPAATTPTGNGYQREVFEDRVFGDVGRPAAGRRHEGLPDRLDERRPTRRDLVSHAPEHLPRRGRRLVRSPPIEKPLAGRCSRAWC